MISLNKPRSQEKTYATFLRRRFAIFVKFTTRATREVIKEAEKAIQSSPFSKQAYLIS